MTEGRGRAGLGTTVALVIGVVAAASFAPAVAGDDGSDAPPTAEVSRPGVPTSLVPDLPTTTTTSPIPAVLRLRVVPAIRDVAVLIDGQRHTSGADGVIAAPTPNGEVLVTVLGSTVTPPFQMVTFARWGDGDLSPTRTLTVTGEEPVLDLGVEVDYQVTLTNAPGVDQAMLIDEGGEILPVPIDIPTWVPALRAVKGPDGGLEAETIRYRVELDGEPATGGPIVPTPEALFPLG